MSHGGDETHKNPTSQYMIETQSLHTSHPTCETHK